MTESTFFSSFNISTVIQILIFIGIIWQVHILNKTYKADNERKKKQSTIEYMNSIRSSYRNFQW